MYQFAQVTAVFHVLLARDGVISSTMLRPFVPAETPLRYAPDRPVRVLHIHLDVELDFAARAIAGTATLTLAARAALLTRIELDAVDMQISTVTLGGKRVTGWTYDHRRLTIPLATSPAAGTELTVAVRYRAEPRRGLYFLAPDADDPTRPEQCWTQGQDEDARCFFPCIDAPTEKSTSEIVCTAPSDKQVLSNGDLLSREPAGKQRTRWHYKLSSPHSSYLLTLVCGDFAEFKSRAKQTGVEVHGFAPKDRKKDAERTLGKTAAMIDFFSQRIGVRYPHKRYSQIFVADFIFGGMENTTATTLTDQAIIDDRAALDHDVDDLVAHELAHQWWGDLVTCRDWSEAWLNEGFATYFEYIWCEHDKGQDEADVLALAQMDSYLHEATEYQRPIVCKQYREPIEIFDSHLYEKGGRVLHFLRNQAGDDAFFAALKLYCERHAGGSVETRDLAQAIEETTGRNWDGFFAEWVGQAGHPHLEGSWAWDPDRKIGSLRLEQKQAGTGVFHFDVRVCLEIGGREVDHVFRVTERSHTFDIPLGASPEQVIVDPGRTLPATWKFEKPLPLWLRQLDKARRGIDRVMAARALADEHAPPAEKALAVALTDDAFWAVRAEAARSLGTIGTISARTTLIERRRDKHPRVRRAIAQSLGNFIADSTAASALVDWVESGDASYFVEAEASRALGRTRDPRAIEITPLALARPAFQDVVRARTVAGLGESTLDAAIDLVLPFLKPNVRFQTRRAAAVALGKLGAGSAHLRRVREHLELTLTDRNHAVRGAVASALAELRDPQAMPSLQKARSRELDGRTRRQLDEAMTALHEGQTPAETVRRLNEQMELLRQETVRLRERVANLEGPRTIAVVRPPNTSRRRPGRRRRA